METDGHGLSAEQVRHLVHRYGSRVSEVVELLSRESDLRASLVPGMPEVWAEVVYAAQTDMAVRPEDVLLRRTHLALKDPAGSGNLEGILQKKFGLAVS